MLSKIQQLGDRDSRYKKAPIETQITPKPITPAPTQKVQAPPKLSKEEIQLEQIAIAGKFNPKIPSVVAALKTLKKKYPKTYLDFREKNHK
jgi:hypothetical protein